VGCYKLNKSYIVIIVCYLRYEWCSFFWSWCIV